MTHIISRFSITNNVCTCATNVFTELYISVNLDKRNLSRLYDIIMTIKNPTHINISVSVSNERERDRKTDRQREHHSGNM